LPVRKNEQYVRLYEFHYWSRRINVMPGEIPLDKVAGIVFISLE